MNHGLTQGLRTLISGLIDYAGLFPPAKLSMGPAVEHYARMLQSEHAWALARFICPASRLKELSQHAASLMPGTHATSGYREMADIGEPWRISAIADADLRQAVDQINAFNDHHDFQDHGLAIVDAIEVKLASADEVEGAVEIIPDELYPFFEVPADLIMKDEADCRGFIASLAGHAAAAKIRTGGVTPEAFPSPRAIARFLIACVGADMPFKATAGLHHPIRAEYNLTYEPGCPRGVMHGFLNLFVAAAMAYVHRAHEGGDRALAMLTGVLEERDPHAFKFTEEGVRWNTALLTTSQIAKAREAFALSYGSCSFDEPIEDLKKLSLL
jgi:hypothetical protein